MERTAPKEGRAPGLVRRAIVCNCATSTTTRGSSLMVRLHAPACGHPPPTKVQLCKFWYDGRCKRGDQCVFAHGLAELREPPSEWPAARTDMSGPRCPRGQRPKTT